MESLYPKEVWKFFGKFANLKWSLWLRLGTLSFLISSKQRLQTYCSADLFFKRLHFFTRYFLSFLYVLIFTFVYFHKRFLAWLCRLGLFAKSFVNNTLILPSVLVVLPYRKKIWKFTDHSVTPVFST